MCSPETLPHLLTPAARNRALVLEFDGSQYTCAELWDRANVAASALLERGIEQGETVVLSLGNGPEFLDAFFGAQLAGAIPVPVYPGSGTGRLQRLAERCDARRAICSSAKEADAAGHGLSVLTPDDLKRPTPTRHLPAISGEDVAYIQFTSGSTGEPKGVVLSHRNVLANIDQLIAGFGITASDRFVSWLPIYHDMGLVLMTLVPLAVGAHLTLLPATLRSLRPWLAAIETQRGTFIAAPDFGYRMALRLLHRGDRPDLSSLRVALNAAEPVRAQTIETFERAAGLRRVMIAGYGLAEATVGVSAARPGSAPLVDDDGVVSVGRSFPGVEVAVWADGRPADPGQRGEVFVRGPACTTGYRRERSDAEPSARPDGFLPTGDLGYLDRDGRLFVIGRTKNMILQAGRNLAPREIEELVDGLAWVRRSAAIGIDRGDRAGEQAYLFVEGRGAAATDRQELRERIVQVVAVVYDELGIRPGRVYLTRPRTIPLTDSGKIRYTALRDRYLTGALRRENLLLYPEY